MKKLLSILLSLLLVGEASAVSPIYGGGGGGVAGPAEWGDITGTLGDQTDLDTALDGKQTLDADLTALGGLTSAADRLPYFTGSATASLATFTSTARLLLDDASESAMRTTLGLAIGTNVQAFDADLSTWAGITPGTNVAALLATAAPGVTWGVFALDADLDALTSDVSGLTFADLGGRVAHIQINHTASAPIKVGDTITGATGGSYIYTITAASTVDTLAISGSANAADETHFQIKFDTDLTYPFTLTIPTSITVGSPSSASATTIVVGEASTHELSFQYNGTSTILVHTVGSSTIADTTYSSAWDTVTTQAGSMNKTYDYLHLFDTDDDGKVNVLDLGTAGLVTTTSGGVVGFVAAPAGTVVGTTDTQTLTNKRIDPRVNSITSDTTWAPDFGTYDQEEQTALAGDITAIAAPIGTPVNGQRRLLRLTNNATPHTITGWDTIYRVIGVSLPSTIGASKTIYVGVIYNSTATKWDVVAVSTEA